MQDRSLQDSSQIQALAKELLPEGGDDALANLTALKAALEDARRWREDSERLYQEMTEERGRLAELKRQQQQAVDGEQDILNILYPVSYTHLDVYKRQTKRHAKNSTFIIHKPDEKSKPLQLLSYKFFIRACLRIGCASSVFF